MIKSVFTLLISFILLLYSCDIGNKRQSKSSEKGHELKFGVLNDSDRAEDYLKYVTAYADAMISEGQDIYGAEKTPLFASTLNRSTMRIDSVDSFESIKGVRKNDRSIGGSNPLGDIGLYHILYALSDITDNELYESEADKSIAYFFKNCQSPVTGLMAWGEHLYWDLTTEACGYGKANQDYHECGVWPFWDSSYKLAPEACWKFAMGEWDHQIADKETGNFSRHARWSQHGPFKGFEFPRYAGQMIERWADAYQRSENVNQARREELLQAIQVVFRRMELNRNLTKSGLLPAGSTAKGDHNEVVWLKSNLELARCLEIAAPLFDNEIAAKMNNFALQQDIDFLEAPHTLEIESGGFAVTLHADTGLPRSRSMNQPYTTSWGSGYGYGPHSRIANLCFDRHIKLISANPELSARYKELMIAASEKYLVSNPDTLQLLKPDVFASVIELMLNSYELTGDRRFIERADYFGQLGITQFLDKDSPLPKATNQHNHYETITGGPKFMNELLNLHLAFSNDIKLN